MPSLRSPIRGAGFRPPANLVLKHVPSGLPLLIEADPQNPYDSNAIKVLVAKSDLAPYAESFSEALADFGVDKEEFFSDESPLWLAFIAKEETSLWHNALASGQDLSPSLGFAPDGKPLILCEV